MDYIKPGQKVRLRGVLSAAHEAVIAQVGDMPEDDHVVYGDTGTPVQIKLTLYPGEESTFLWVGLDCVHALENKEETKADQDVSGGKGDE